MTATVITDLSTTERAPATAGRMASAALDFLASLNDMQRQAAEPSPCVFRFFGAIDRYWGMSRLNADIGFSAVYDPQETCAALDCCCAN